MLREGKRAELVVEGAGVTHPVRVLPGMSAREVLEAAGLDADELELFSPEAHRLLDPHEELHDMVDDGDRLSVSTRLEVARS